MAVMWWGQPDTRFLSVTPSQSRQLHIMAVITTVTGTANKGSIFTAGLFLANTLPKLGLCDANDTIYQSITMVGGSEIGMIQTLRIHIITTRIIRIILVLGIFHFCFFCAP